MSAGQKKARGIETTILSMLTLDRKATNGFAEICGKVLNTILKCDTYGNTLL